MTDDHDDRRQHIRVPIELKVEYKRLNTFFADYTKNISKGGTFIKTNKALKVGTEFIFSLTVPNLPEPIKLLGRVVWVVKEGDPPNPALPDEDDPGMGIRFIYDSDDQRALIHAAVERLMVDSLGPIISQKLMNPDE